MIEQTTRPAELEPANSPQSPDLFRVFVLQLLIASYPRMNYTKFGANVTLKRAATCAVTQASGRVRTQLLK